MPSIWYILRFEHASESNLEPSPAGFSDPLAKISGLIVMVRRSGNLSRGTATGCIFSPIGIVSAYAKNDRLTEGTIQSPV